MFGVKVLLYLICCSFTFDLVVLIFLSFNVFFAIGFVEVLLLLLFEFESGHLEFDVWKNS